MKGNKFKTCVLGSGPTARLCSYFLQNTQHIVIGQQNNFGSLSVTYTNNNQVNLLPIFPVFNSTLYNELWKEGNTKHNFLTYSEQGNIIVEFEKIMDKINNANVASYAIKCLSVNQDIGIKRNIILAYKLLGSVIFEYECVRLFEKVNRHYNTNNSNKRIGYIDNLSAYYEKIKSIKINNFISDDIEKIDVDKKQIVTKNLNFKYQKLISTINLKEFINKIDNPPEISLISRPAFFSLIKSKDEFPSDIVFYDCKVNSPVYRIFTISSNILIVQFAFGHQEIEFNSLLPYLYELLSRTFEIESEYRYKIDDAYPIESSSDTILKKFVLELESKNVYLLGRYAEWEYLDLHELNFSKI